MPRDGCKQCSRRRIRCDKTGAQCQKCSAKGLDCSGYGVDYRFAADVAASRRSSRQNKSPNGRRLQLKNQGTVERRASSIFSEINESSTQSLSPILRTNSTNPSTLRSASPSHSPSGRDSEVSVSSWRWPHPAADLALEGLKPGISHLFNHFSSIIASIMVTFDRGTNGYRNIIPPSLTKMSLFNELQDPTLYATAEAGRTAIITKLSQSARRNENANDVFNLSTLVTLLVLLVGEMVTGSTEFNHLYSMMTALLQGNNILKATSPSVEAFLMQQVYLGRMVQLARDIVDMALRFQLFVRPFLDPAPGAVMLEGNIKHHLDFITCFSDCGPWYSAQVSCLEGAVQLAKDIYLEDYNGEHHPNACHIRLERLRDMTSSITLATPGMHALVWPYFVAAASSRSQDHREYFVFKLREIHQKTPMNNILIAIERLEEIWERFPSGGWTKCLGRFRPILAV
ncbi:hypothetical protein D0860_05065 [Hortaea werneckii]|uniref:Zn(2)-C6 fungal-type domain-containing protein n=1 Tax=Hortaea werneckii TaxID=91943 RepID=A0A3M7H2T2_HORWE|nr:hypothetical protein D0860_05065 [Hortaea werneckii]